MKFASQRFYFFEIHFLKILILENCLFSSRHFVIITDNGPRLCDSGGLEILNFQFCTKISNSLLLFSKFMKKGNIKCCCD